MIALALLLVLGAADPVHDAIQQLVEDVQGGKDFTQGRFKDAVSAGDAAKLAALKPCALGKVTRTEGDRMAMVGWDCPAETKLGHPSLMLMFDSGKVTTIQPVAFVDVQTRGN